MIFHCENGFLISFPLFSSGSDPILKYQESTFPYNILHNLTIPNRTLGVVQKMTDFELFLIVLAEWRRPKDGRSLIVRRDFGFAFSHWARIGFLGIKNLIFRLVSYSILRYPTDHFM